MLAGLQFQQVVTAVVSADSTQVQDAWQVVMTQSHQCDLEIEKLATHQPGVKSSSDCVASREA